MAVGQHVLEFTPDGKLFALINDQGVLRVWDTETNELKQEYTPNLHLGGPCSALTWISPSKKSRKSAQSADALYLALGTSTGSVSLYSYALGKIEKNLEGEGHNGRITGIANNQEGHLYTCGEDGQIVVWSLQKGKKLHGWSAGAEKLYSIEYLRHSKSIVVAGRKIQVYAAATKELIQSFTGHSSEINLVTSFLLNDSLEYAITTSRMERIMCVWKLNKKGQNKAAVCTLLMEDVAHCITSQVNAMDGTLQVASVTRSGVIHVYHIPADALKADKPIKPKVTIEIASDSTDVIEPISVLAARIYHTQRPEELLFGYGDNNFMIFEHIAPNFTGKMQVLIRADPKRLQRAKSSKKLGSAAALKTITPTIKNDEVDYKSSVTLVAGKKKLKPLDMPMESRLQNLNLADATGAAAPQAQSKVQLLVQSLHSKDQTLLRSVLCTDDQKTIQLTLQRLPVQYVATLVNELTLLMQLKRCNVEYSMKWLKILAQTHSSQLMSLGADDLLNKFGVCIGIIEHRANCLKELSKLSGRLQLLVSQIKHNAEADNLNSENVLVYEDSDPSNSDLDENSEQNASDSEWEEDADEQEEMEHEGVDEEDDDESMAS